MKKEQSVLDTLINKGYSFKIKQPVIHTTRYFFGLLKRHTVSLELVDYLIKEPTLDVLDRMSVEWIKMDADLEGIEEENQTMSDARFLVTKHSYRLARCVAIATIGREYWKPIAGSSVMYKEDDDRLLSLTNIFAKSITPSQLYKINLMLQGIANLGDFMMSIRLTELQRTTAPNRVDKKA